MDLLNAPNTSAVSQSLCDAIRCGAYPDYSTVPGGVAAVVACSQTYGASAFGQCDDRCKPYWSTIAQNNPSLNPAVQCAPQPAVAQPTPVATIAQTILPAVTLTPQNVVQPLPDITRALEPVPIPTSKCSLWCDLNAAIAEHPVMAIAILIGTAYVIGSRRG